MKLEKGDTRRKWIIRNALEIIDEYEDGILTIRGLHYRLVSRGMTNDQSHYNSVSAAMTEARWEELVDFDFFVDNERESIGETEYGETEPEDAADRTMRSITYWMNNYYKNRWENQPYYPEVFIEKKALQGVFESVCGKYNVALNPCKGYASLTFVHEAYQRFSDAKAEGKTPVILYFGDHDPSGDDIPRSLQENIARMGLEVELRRMALTKEQVIEMNLPPAPVKKGDSRGSNWDGLGQVELDAVEPRKLQQMCKDAILSVFDQELYDELKSNEEIEKEEYKKIIKDSVKDL